MTILTRRKERIPIPARPQFEGTYYRYAVRAAARQLQNMSFPPLLPCLPGRCRCVFLRQCVTPSPFLPSFLLHLEFNALSSAAAVSPFLPSFPTRPFFMRTARGRNSNTHSVRPTDLQFFFPFLPRALHYSPRMSNRGNSLGSVVMLSQSRQP